MTVFSTGGSQNEAIIFDCNYCVVTPQARISWHWLTSLTNDPRSNFATFDSNIIFFLKKKKKKKTIQNFCENYHSVNQVLFIRRTHFYIFLMTDSRPLFTLCDDYQFSFLSLIHFEFKTEFSVFNSFFIAQLFLSHGIEKLHISFSLKSFF